MFTSGVVRQVQGRELEDGAGIMANVEGNLPANVKKSIQRNLVQGELMAPCRKRLDVSHSHALQMLLPLPWSKLVERSRVLPVSARRVRSQPHCTWGNREWCVCTE